MKHLLSGVVGIPKLKPFILWWIGILGFVEGGYRSNLVLEMLLPASSKWTFSGHSSRGDLLVSCSEVRSLSWVSKKGAIESGGNDSGYCKSKQRCFKLFFVDVQFIFHLYFCWFSDLLKICSYGRNGRKNGLHHLHSWVLAQDRQVIVWTEQVGVIHMWGLKLPLGSLC